MISQIYILSLRGDVVIKKEFRSDVPKDSGDAFFRNYKLSQNEVPPVICLHDVNFMYMVREGMILLCTSRENLSPSYAFDLMLSIIRVIKDFCGRFSEDTIRKNFILVYELLEEMIDFGYAQTTNTETLKNYIKNEPVLQNLSIRSSIFSNELPQAASQRPITKNKEEIFIDIIEKISGLFNFNGYTINSSIEGCLQMKAFLQDNSELELCLDDSKASGLGEISDKILFEDCNFHYSADYSRFTQDRILTITPPKGEFTVINYRIKGDYNYPFRIFPYVDDIDKHTYDVSIKLKALFPQKVIAKNVAIKFVLPKCTKSAKFNLIKGIKKQHVRYDRETRTVNWDIDEMNGNCEEILQTILGTKEEFKMRDLNQVSLNFEIANHCVSNLRVNYVKVIVGKKGKMPKWIRYTTKSSSYVCRA